MIKYYLKLTENSDDHIVLYHLHGSVADVIDVREGIAFVDEVFAGGAEVVPNM